MSGYELRSLKLPKLYGMGLKVFASALENPVTLELLKNNLLENGGINKLREARFSDPPTFLPAVNAEQGITGVHPLPQLEQVRDKPGSSSPYWMIRDYAEAYAEGRTTPFEVARRFLSAVEDGQKLEMPLCAFSAIRPENVLAQATESTQRWQSGKPISIFDGVPIAVKDEFDMTPYPTTVGTSFLGAEPARVDATMVFRLRAAGALLLGKANMHEIGINPEGYNLHYGRACNPWSLRHDTGGSSSGPAVATAAGFCPVSLGADGGGSIRIPAALCGLVGLKPTFGRVSVFGAAPLAWSVDCVGPLSCSVEDLVLTYSVIAGPDPKDTFSLSQPPMSTENWNLPDLSGLRLGVYWPWFRHAHPEVVAANEKMLTNLCAAGASVVEVEIQELDYMRIAHAVTILSEIATNMSLYPKNRKDFAPSTRISLALAREFTAQDYLAAQRIRTRAMRIMKDVFSQVDIIISPATSLTAPRVPDAGLRNGWSDLSTVTELMRFAFISNFVGLPAIAFPVGYSMEGLPISMQAMGNHWQEHLLLRIAYTAEQHMQKRLPPVYYDLMA